MSTLHTVQISTKVQSELNDFIHWHFDLKEKVDSLKIGPKEEGHYLENIYPTNRGVYNEKVKRLGQLCENLSSEAKAKLFQAITNQGIPELLKDCPYFFQAIYKPRGYPGDAEMMALVYRNQFEGQDLFSKILHKIGTDCGACIAIRNRKELLINAFKELNTGKVLSLAAGPAQEIYEFQEYESNSLDFLALDHDIETVKNASRNQGSLKYGILNAFHLIKGNKTFLIPRKVFLPYCRPKKDVKGLRRFFALPTKYSFNQLQSQSFDLVYSAGLFDYIKTFPDPTKGTKALMQILFDLLKPGGRLLIGNVSPKMSIGERWVMECKCDWYLFYRTKKEVLEFTASIPEHQIAHMEVIAEETGVNWFLDLQKK